MSGTKNKRVISVSMDRETVREIDQIEHINRSALLNKLANEWLEENNYSN